MIVAEIRAMDQRIHLTTRAIRILVISGLAIGTTVAVLFLEEMANIPLERVAAGFFLVSISLLMWGLVLFLQETRIAAATLRIPRDYLELERDL
jgi:hypothetical protein